MPPKPKSSVGTNKDRGKALAPPLSPSASSTPIPRKLTPVKSWLAAATPTSSQTPNSSLPGSATALALATTNQVVSKPGVQTRASSALVSTAQPIQVTSATQHIVVSSNTGVQPPAIWFNKEYFPKVASIEKEFYHIGDPFKTADSIFPPSWFYTPYDILKPREYYERILSDTASFEFKHFIKSEPIHPDYSTARILGIVHPRDWLPSPHTAISFENNSFNVSSPKYRQLYTYYDYQQGWYTSFLRQNSRRTHTWLFFFERDFNTENLPHWFSNWWEMFGPLPNILPPEFKKGFDLFFRQYKPPSHEVGFPLLLLFFIHFHLSWVFSWTFDFQQNREEVILIRKFKVKWWNNFKFPDRCTPSSVSRWLQENNIQKTEPSPPPLALKALALSKLAGAKTDEETAQLLLQMTADIQQGCQASDEGSSSYLPQNEDDCYGIDYLGEP